MFEFLVIFFLIALIWKGFIPAILTTLSVLFLILVGISLYVYLGIWAVILAVSVIAITAYAEVKGVHFG